MKILPVEQGSVDWAIARSGIPTASEFDNLVTPKFEARDGVMPKTYLAKKLAEAWTGGPLVEFNTFDMDQGTILQDEAIPWFELTLGQSVERVGLVTTDDGRIGCSPDGLLGDHGGLEIKCPAIHTHIKYLLDGGLPKDYAAQVHGAMFVTGRRWWKFLSYRRHFPALLFHVERDEAIQERLREALDNILAEFDAAMKTLEALNGGPPKRFTRTTPIPTALNDENDSIP